MMSNNNNTIVAVSSVPKDDRVKIIGFCGQARCGKDTAALAVGRYVQRHTELCDEFQDTYIVAAEAFAAPIKSMIAMLLDHFGLGSITDPKELVPYIDGDKKEEVIPPIGASARTLMQTLGTEWGRQTVNEDIWIHCMLERLSNYSMMVDHGFQGAIVVITDVRFENEARALSDIGATIVRIERENLPDIQGVPEHASEAGVPDKYVNRTILNSADSAEGFDAQVLAALADLLPELPEDRDDAPDEE